VWGKSLECTKSTALAIYGKTGRLPTEEDMRLFSYLFYDRSKPIPESLRWFIDIFYYKDKCYEAWKYTSPQFGGLDEFLKYCGL
jgi:hypothetical protein